MTSSRADAVAERLSRSAEGLGGRALPFDLFCRDRGLVRAWQRLETSTFLPTQSHAFSEALARTLLAHSVIEIFLATGLEGIGALLPLCRNLGFFARWRMMGAREVFEPCDALSADPGAARRLAGVIVAGQRPLSLDRVPAESPLVPAFKAAMQGKGWLSVRPAQGCPTIALDASWAQPEAQFNAGRRSDFRRATRRAEEIGDVAFEVLCPTPEQFDAVFDEAAEVELRSWKKEAGTAIVSDREKEHFFRTYFRSACEQGTLRIAFMRIDGRAVGMQMALECLDRYWLFKIGYDEAYGKCSPGTLLMLHTIGYAASRGLSAYELLGGVEPWIAEFWTKDRHECVRLRTYPFGVRGAVALAVDLAVWLGTRIPKPRR